MWQTFVLLKKYYKNEKFLKQALKLFLTLRVKNKLHKNSWKIAPTKRDKKQVFKIQNKFRSTPEKGLYNVQKCFIKLNHCRKLS